MTDSLKFTERVFDQYDRIHQIEFLKAYLTKLDMSTHDTLTYWQKAYNLCPDDPETGLHLIIAKEVAKEQRKIINNLFRLLSHPEDFDAAKMD